MRIPRNRADASPRPAGSTRPRSPHLILTEPRQTNLIAPSPPDQIGTTPQNPSETEKSSETDHRRPRSTSPPAPRGEMSDRATVLSINSVGAVGRLSVIPAQAGIHATAQRCDEFHPPDGAPGPPAQRA